MTLTKKQEAAILKAYHSMWRSYLKGDMKSFATYLHPRFQVMGTAEKEWFLNKRTALKFYGDTASQVSGIVQLRNRSIRLSPLDENVFIDEQCLMYVLIDGKWILYGPLRISCVFTNAAGRWQNLHQHASFPDARAAEGEQLATEKIAEENLQLKEAVRRRTLELEAKNRELEIEAALEKVRSVAMGMQHADDMLDICQTISAQLSALGVKDIRNVQTAIIYEDRGAYMNYEYYARHDKLLATEVLYTNHAMTKAFIKKMLSGPNEFFKRHLKGKKVQEWYAFQKSTNQFADKYLANATSLNYYWYSLGPVALGISTYSPLSEAEEVLCQRFRNVFELSYRRFLDIEKAVARAREAQIEAALERVRVASLAMRDSSALGKIIFTLYSELAKLDAKLDRVFIMIVNHANKGITWWMAGQEGLLAENGFFVQMNQHPTHLMYLDHCEKRRKKWTYLFEGKEKMDCDRFLFSKTELARLPVPVKESMAGVGKIFLSGSSDFFGCLTTGSLEPLSDHHQNIISRFATVFNQAYTRFLDLQKAEAQAREAQIEAALERVRSRSMAMHNSQELKEVIRVVLQQLVHLNINVEHAGFYINYREQDDMHIWLADPNLEPFYAVLPYFDSPTWKSFLDAKTTGKNFYTDLLDFKTKNKFYKALFKIFHVPDEAKKFYLACKGLAVSTVLLDNVGLYIENFSAIPYADEENRILMRFGKVFQQTYTRFLDLQKAESQAREAQIEASLEKVRARSLAMQKPDELIDVAKLLRSEMGALGVEALETGSIYIMGDRDTAECWYAIKDVRGKNSKLVSDEMTLQLADTWVGKEMRKFYHSQQEQASIVMKGQHRKDWINYCAKRSKVLKGYYGDEIPERTYHLVKFPGGYLGAAASGEISNESWDLLKRAAVVFSLAYTRFKDLQDAEARAKEAQIELALERVRARSLAMHHTSELQEVVNVVAQQLLGIGIDINGGVFIVINDEIGEDLPLWASAGMTDYVQKAVVPFLKQPFFTRLHAALKNPNHLYIEHCSRKEKLQLFEHLFQFEPWKSAPAKRKKELLAREGGLCRSVAVSKHTSIAITDHYGKSFSSKENEVLKRFGKVFEQAYIRFLDLQKAEMQAREAQIEAALERVRSRSMAMHNSDELLEVSSVLFEQFQHLGQPADQLSIGIMNEAAGVVEICATVQGQQLPKIFNHSIHEPYVMNKIFNGWKTGRKSLDLTMSAKELNAYNRFRNKIVGKALFDTHTDRKQKREIYASYFFGGMLAIATNELLLDETRIILNRFAKVFEQTYTRFLDLQRAEAQARESQIEAALERVRAKSLAMHHSSELSAVVDTLLQEFTKLEFSLTFCIINLINEADRSNTVWAANPETGKGAESYYMKFEDYDFHHAMWNAWKAQDKRFVYTLEGEEKRLYDEYLFSDTEFRRFPKHVQDANKALERYVAGFTFFKYSGLQTVSVNEITDAELEILERFGKVFEQAYTRFLDLQKAEAQAREAQIEAALERVRSRSMAMHKSEELADLSLELVKQVQALGVKTWFCAFNIYDEDAQNSVEWGSNGEGTFERYRTPREGIFLRYYEAGQRGETLHINVIGEDECPAHYEYLCSLPGVGDQLLKMKAAGIPFPASQIDHVAFFKYGYLLFISYEPVPESHDIFKRFAKTFEQSYTRFLDLQRAEAQAREAEIQLTLERVRARTMAMQKSDELADVAVLLFAQVRSLGIDCYSSGFTVWENNDSELVSWMCNADGSINPPFRMPADDNEWHRQQYESWKREEDYVIHDFTGAEMEAQYRYLRSFPLLDEAFKKSESAGVKTPVRQVHNAFNFNHGNLLFITLAPVPEVFGIFLRFAKTFEQTYARFLDLQRAEAQAREARIEAALERVRSRTMAMQKSEDMNQTAAEMFRQIQALGMEPWGCGFNIFDRDEKAVTQYMSLADGGISPPFRTPLTEDPFFIKIYDARQRKDELLVMESKGESLAETYRYMFALPGSGEIFGDLENSGFEMPKFQVTHCAYFSQGYLVFITYGQVSEAHDIFKRFAKVFEQTYTRFLDLQKAEAQAREAQIETALERVRAKAMSMHASHELKEVVHELRKQMGLLGQKDLETCVIHLHDESPDFIHSWAAIKPPETESEILESTARVPKKGLLIIEEALEAYTANRQDYIMINEGKKLQQWFSFLKQESPEGYRKLAESVKGRIENLRAFWSFADFSGGSLLMVTMDEPDDQTRGLLRRFANVFGLAYRRFADLKQAEAQAREAQIEAALERVRSKAMAMHNSADLPSTAIIAFTELKKLGFVPIRCGISIQNKENRKNLLYSATTSGEGDTLSLVGWAILDNHPVLSEVYDQWMKGEDCFPELKGELLRTYYEQVRNSFDVPVEQTLIEQYGYFISFTHGLFYGWCEQPVTEDEKKLLKRFAAVIDLTFKRYFDLQKAEAQAREAQVEAALEKVRSRTLAMQKSDELAGTAAVLFQQLISLGIAPNRLYIILTEENSYEMEAWVTDEDGSKVSMGFTGNYQKNQSLQKMYEGWKQQKKSLVIDMQGEELQSYFHYLHDELKVPFKGGLEQKRRIQHLAYFSHGMIGMASPEEQPAETLQLMERFASVFNLTFTRFNDLKIAEAHAMQAEQDLIAIKEAKQKAEEALTELQATQKQLVQSEKMASLGELTAGIAHEIQNPLNFVNNFSEVSADLLQELVEEMEKGNTQDAKEIAQDLVNNLQKIHHHGERAASIVKGMLQHSRSSSGQKEPTDINALCDEYLRLAYHGLRAKDKSFNAKFETSFDDSIGKISVMPQELGRVMLNLINNAFYATGERKNYNEPGYEPCVTVSSERVADKIIIKVKDNGTGIPPQAVDKIFQPFFTTKPTGQGTGLGLSLSYDIVTKAHGGELKVETKDGEGTTFIIHLPVVRITD